MPVSQFSPLANRRAIVVFPTPRVPEKDKHDVTFGDQDH